MAELYNGVKLDEGMSKLKKLRKEVEGLERNLSFVPVLPPNLAEARNYIEQRKSYLHSLIKEIEDASFGC